MAGYRYEIRSYNTYSGVAPVAEKWKKPMYAESDHGMDQPSGSTESYLVKSERIFEQVHTSNVTDGVERSGWDRPRKVEDFITQVQTQPRPHLLRQGARQPLGVPIPSPSPDYKHNRYSSSEPASDRWSRSSSPIRDPLLEGNSKVQPLTRPGFLGDGTRAVYSPAADPSSENKNNTWGRPVGGRAGSMSPVVEYMHSSNSPSKDHVTENNPSRPGLLRSANWRQSPNSTAAYESGREMDKGRPGGHSYAPSDYSAPEKYPVEASPQRGGGTNWTRAGRGGRPLTRPTNNIKEAVNYLAGALQQQQQQFYETKMDHYTETIDSSDAQSRYGKLSGSSRETYSTTIDSREAVRKYCGAAI